jgi:hypothetical protein
MRQTSEGTRGILAPGALALVFALGAIAPSCVKAQIARSRKDAPLPMAAPGTSAGPGKVNQLVLDYYPSGLFATKDSELFSVVIGSDGRTQAVRYGFYDPAIIAVYEGTITRADVGRLVARARAAIPKAVQKNIQYQGSCDSESFQMSLNYQNPSQTKSTLPYPICLPVMPREIFDLVEEMRGLWKRLPESRLADGYVQSFVFEKDFLKSPHRNIKQFAPIQKFPPRLRAIVRDATKHSPKFYPISRARLEALRALRSDPSHFFVIDNGRGYSLDLYAARPISVPRPR